MESFDWMFPEIAPLPLGRKFGAHAATIAFVPITLGRFAPKLAKQNCT